MEILEINTKQLSLLDAENLQALIDIFKGVSRPEAKTIVKQLSSELLKRKNESTDLEEASAKDLDIKSIKALIKKPSPEMIKQYGGKDKYIKMLKSKLAKLESTELVEYNNRLKAHTPAAAKRLIKKLKNKFSGYTWDRRIKGDEIIYPLEPHIVRFIKKQPEVADMNEEVSLEEAKNIIKILKRASKKIGGIVSKITGDAEFQKVYAKYVANPKDKNSLKLAQKYVDGIMSNAPLSGMDECIRLKEARLKKICSIVLGEDFDQDFIYENIDFSKPSVIKEEYNKYLNS